MSKRINTKKTTVKTVSTEIKDAVEKTEVVSTAEEKKKADKPKAEPKKKADEPKEEPKEKADKLKEEPKEKADKPKAESKKKVAKSKTVTRKRAVRSKTVTEGKVAEPKTTTKKKTVRSKAATKEKADATKEKAAVTKEKVVVTKEKVIAPKTTVEQNIPIEQPDLGPRRSVAFIGSECYPFVKTGGLGDVMSALPKALAKLNLDVKVILPRYKCIPQEYQEKMEYRGSFYMNLCSDGKQYYVDRKSVV